jgi:hypothetical protein
MGETVCDNSLTKNYPGLTGYIVLDCSLSSESQNKTGGGLAGSPKETLGMLSTKNASSSVSKFIGDAPLNQSASNSSSTK